MDNAACSDRVRGSSSLRARLAGQARERAFGVAANLMDGASHAVRALPAPLRYVPADAITVPLGVLWASRRPVIERNVATAFGLPLGDPRVARLARRSIRNYGRMAIDFLTVRTMSDAEVLAWVTPVGAEHLDAALRAGRGVILALAHLGSWDVAAAFAQAYGCRLTVVTEDTWAARLVAGSRTGHGVTLAPRDRSLRTLFRTLARNDCVALLGDIAHPGVQTVDVPFFGRPAPFPVGPARLAQHTGAPLLPVSCVRLPDHSYRIEARPPLWPHDHGRGEDGAVALTAALVACYERFIRECPQQWYPYRPMWPAETGRQRAGQP